MTLDFYLIDFIASRRISSLNPVMVLLSNQLFLAAVCLGWATALLFAIRPRARAWMAILALVASIGLADLLCVKAVKPWIDRPRPCHLKPEIALPGACKPSKSMPSNHAATMAGGATVVGFLLRRRGVFLGLLPLALVGVSRVYLGAHFPSDVLVGALLGLASAAAVLATWRRWAEKQSPAAPSPSSTS